MSLTSVASKSSGATLDLSCGEGLLYCLIVYSFPLVTASSRHSVVGTSSMWSSRSHRCPSRMNTWASSGHRTSSTRWLYTSATPPRPSPWSARRGPPPGGKTVPEVDISLSIGPVRKALLGSGTREWKGLLSGSIFSPALSDKMPFIDEQAFGGVLSTMMIVLNAQRRGMVSLDALRCDKKPLKVNEVKVGLDWLDLGKAA